MRSALLSTRRAVRASTATLVTMLAAMTGACRDAATPAASASPVGGTMVISALSDADLLMPPLTITGQGLQVVDAVFDRLAQPVLGNDGVLFK